VISIILNSLRPARRVHLENLGVGLVHRVVILALTGVFLTGSFQWPAKVQFFWESQVPSLTINPVDMLSFHVDQYLPVTLSYPIMP